MRYKHKPRPPMRDNSCALSVRMTEEQYQRLCRYLAITRLPVTTYFRKLIKGATIHARMPRQKIDPHPRRKPYLLQHPADRPLSKGQRTCPGADRAAGVSGGQAL